MLKKQGMYLPEFEHDNCGAGFICSLEGNKSNDIIHKALQILERLEHRGAVSSDGKTGDGAGILLTFHMSFLLVIVILIYQVLDSMQLVMCFCPKKRTKEIIVSLFLRNV